MPTSTKGDRIIIGAALKVARLNRKRIANTNETNRTTVTGRAEFPWEHYPDPSYDEGATNRILRLSYSANVQGSEGDNVFVTELVFRGGDQVDFRNIQGDLVAAVPVSQAIDMLAQLIAEFEWPDEKPEPIRAMIGRAA